MVKVNKQTCILYVNCKGLVLQGPYSKGKRFAQYISHIYHLQCYIDTYLYFLLQSGVALDVV